LRNYFIQKRSLAALFEGILMDRKNHEESVHNRTHKYSTMYRRERREMNTNTILIHYYYYIRTRETATFSSTFNKGGARLLSETCARHLTANPRICTEGRLDRYICRRRVFHSPSTRSTAREYSPLFCLSFLLLSFSFWWSSRLLVLLASNRTEAET